MPTLNKVQLIGNLGKDPEAAYTPNGNLNVKVSLAVNNRWTDKSGEKHEETEWVNLEVWGRLAEIFREYLKKGSSVYVEGRLKTDKWTPEGATESKYFTKVVVTHMQMLGGRKGDENGSAPAEIDEMAGLETEVPF